MKCSNCGLENAPDANYCAGCKNSLGVPPVAKSTPSAQALPASPASPASPAYNTAPGQAQPDAPPYNSSPSQAQTATPAYTSTPAYNSTPARPAPYTYQQPYYYPLSPIKPKQPFSITDAYIIIGFVLSIIGVFTYAFILLPAGIGFSVIGFVRRTNARTLGLSVAGIVVDVVACFIRVGMLLYELGFIPYLLSSGIF